MSDYLVYIKMPSYLRQWFVHRHSGSEPVVLRQGSIESKLIKLAQSRQPDDFFPPLQRRTRWLFAFLTPRHATHVPTTISLPRAKRHCLITSRMLLPWIAGTSCTTSGILVSNKRNWSICIWSNGASRRTALVGTALRRLISDFARTTSQTRVEKEPDNSKLKSHKQKAKSL